MNSVMRAEFTAMLARLEFKISGPIGASILRGVPTISKIIHGGVSLTPHLALDSPWDLFRDQEH